MLTKNSNYIWQNINNNENKEMRNFIRTKPFTNIANLTKFAIWGVKMGIEST